MRISYFLFNLLILLSPELKFVEIFQFEYFLCVCDSLIVFFYIVLFAWGEGFDENLWKWEHGETVKNYKTIRIAKLFIRLLLPPKTAKILLFFPWERFSRASDKNNQKLIWAQMTQKKSLTMKSYHNYKKTNEQTYSIIS